MTSIVYKEYAPHPALSPFIDAFWTVSGTNNTAQPDKILHDGCVALILNTGPTFQDRRDATPMAAGEAYLVGTMTRYIEMIRPPATQLTGIRFKPGGFSFFYDPSLLRDTADQTLEFDRTLFPAGDLNAPNPATPFNTFFLRRLKTPSQPIQPLIEAIQKTNGRITVSQLARKNFITTRQLQRLFHLHLAITPKAFINFVRYQSAIQLLNTKRTRLLDIACACGYYDHTHLANEIKKYTGATLSHFSKPPVSLPPILD